MERRFEPNTQEPKYPKLEDFVNTELPENVKGDIARLVFNGQSEEIINALITGEGEYIDFEHESDIKDRENFHVTHKALTSYFDENIRKVLINKATELLKDAEDNSYEIQEINSWYQKMKESANELFERWLREIVVLAKECEEIFNDSDGSTITN